MNPQNLHVLESRVIMAIPIDVSRGSLADTWQLVQFLTYCSILESVLGHQTNYLATDFILDMPMWVLWSKSRLYIEPVVELPLYWPKEGRLFQSGLNSTDLCCNDKDQPEWTKCLTLTRTGLCDLRVCYFAAENGTVDSCSSKAITSVTIGTSSGWSSKSGRMVLRKLILLHWKCELMFMITEK